MLKEFNKITWELANRLKDKNFDFIWANVTGGVILANQLRNDLEILRKEEIPYVYAERMRLLKEKTLSGRVVGIKNNPKIKREISHSLLKSLLILQEQLQDQLSMLGKLDLR